MGLARRREADLLPVGYFHLVFTLPAEIARSPTRTRRSSTTCLAGVQDGEEAKIAGGNTARVFNFDAARLTLPA